MAKTIRCPVHGCIDVSPLEWELISTPLFRRLDNVRQLSTASIVYPGGTHTRYSHCVGAMYIAGKYASRLIKSSPEVPFPEKFLKLARVCALLHDIGHGPFSHSFDRAVYSQIYGRLDGGHDDHRLKIVEHPSIADVLRKHGLEPLDLQSVWTEGLAGTSSEWYYNVVAQITQGPLGADRLDFTMRDSYFTGTAHFGTVPLDRIVTKCKVVQVPSTPGTVNLTTQETTYRLAYNKKSLDDVIRVLEGRKAMYINVYLHPKVSAASLVIEKLLREAVNKINLIERTKDLDQFVYVSDMIIGECLTHPELKQLASDVLSFKIPKLVSESIDLKPTKAPVIPGTVSMTTRGVSGFSCREFDVRSILIYERTGEVCSFSEAVRPDQRLNETPVFMTRVYDVSNL